MLYNVQCVENIVILQHGIHFEFDTCMSAMQCNMQCIGFASRSVISKSSGFCCCRQHFRRGIATMRVFVSVDMFVQSHSASN